jgi:hypothetical protein
MNAPYGFVDLTCPTRLITLKNGSTLVKVFYELRTVANVGIIRIHDNTMIWRRVSNWTPELLIKRRST